MIRAAPFAFIAACLGLLAAALLSGGGVVFAAALVVVLALVAMALSRLSLGDVGVGCAVGFALTTSWNAVTIGPIRPADALLLLGLGLLIADAFMRGFDRGSFVLPWWVMLLALAIVSVTVLNAVVPFAPEYVQHRPNFNATGVAVPASGTNLGGAARWLISLLGVPTLITLAGERRRAALRWIAMAFAAGTAVAGGVAVTDRLGVTAVNASLLVDRFGTRQAGLTIQPNHLATVCVLGLPFACWLLTGGRSAFMRGGAALALLLEFAGIVLSGSRGGAAVGALAAVAAVVMLRDLRARVPQISAAGALVMATVLYTNPQLVGLAAATTRLTTAPSVTGSDDVRAMLGAQADTDFGHSPVYGIGLQVIVTAHNIYKQLLAAGGVLLLIGFAVFVVALLRAGRPAWERDQLSVAATVSISAWLVIGAVENILIDRYVYVPVGLLIALSLRYRRADVPDGMGETTVDVSIGARARDTS